MTDIPLPPVPQEFYDENRKRFQAQTHIFEIKDFHKCSHVFYRISYSEVRCKNCTAGWIDNNRFIIEEGKLTGVKEK